MIAALEARLKRMEDAFDTNTAAFSAGIQMLEAQQEVLRRVAQGMLKGGIVSGVDGRIAWNHYLKAFIEELMTSEAKREAANGEPVLVVDSKGSDEPIIFGG